MPTHVIYLGEQHPQHPGSAPVLPPLAPGDTGWTTSPLLQPTQPMPLGTIPMHSVAAAPWSVPPHTVPPLTQPMLLMYPPTVPAPIPAYGSVLGSAVLWLVVVLAIVGTVAVVVLRVAPDRAAHITTQLRRPATASASLPTAQNAMVQVQVLELTADRLVLSVVNRSTQPLALAGDAVEMRADAVHYFMPSGIPIVQMQPGDEHQIVISPVPAGTSLVFRIQVPGADALELKVR